MSELVLGVNICDLDLGAQIDSIKQAFKRNAVGSGHVSHHWTSAFDEHFWSLPRYFQKCTIALHNENNLRLWQRDPHLTVHQHSGYLSFSTWCWHFASSVLLLPGLMISLFFEECNTSITTSHWSREGIPSIRKPASNEIISDSVEQWDTDVCFLHIPLMGTNVRLPKIQKIPAEVDSECSKSPAKSESWKKPNRQCWAVFLTGQYCR